MLSEQVPEHVEKVAPPEPAHQAKAKVVDLTNAVVSVTTAPPSTSDHKSETSSSEEKGEIWHGYQDDDLPEKIQTKFLRNLRFQIMSLYRRLFGIVFITNMGIFIATCVKDLNAKHLAEIVIANLFVAILMRQEYVINTFFAVACLAPQS